jgi:antitoxin VapB
MQTTTLFQNGASQAVRIPKEFRFEGKQVEVKKIGNNLILRPVSGAWESMFKSLEQFSDDFMADGRAQPEQQQREDLFA